MRGCKLRNGVNWHGELKQKCKNKAFVYMQI